MLREIEDGRGGGDLVFWSGGRKKSFIGLFVIRGDRRRCVKTNGKDSSKQVALDLVRVAGEGKR